MSREPKKQRIAATLAAYRCGNDDRRAGRPRTPPRGKLATAYHNGYSQASRHAGDVDNSIAKAARDRLRRKAGR